MRKSRIISAALVSVILLGGAAGGYAASEHKDDEAQEIAAVLNAKTSLADAIAAAERHTGAKAIETGIENENGAIAYEVKVAKGNTVQDVLVDLNTGKVLTVKAADNEHEGHERRGAK
jgi:uncharacterized membrane protein YkoI